MLEQEISFHEKDTKNNLTNDFKEGFINGLKQAKQNILALDYMHNELGKPFNIITRKRDE